jgi:hypothetical protein
MSSYPVHTIESAPAQSKPVLQQLQQAFGLIPNIAAAMAASPVLINGFIGLFERVHASSLTEPQIQTVLGVGWLGTSALVVCPVGGRAPPARADRQPCRPQRSSACCR